MGIARRDAGEQGPERTHVLRAYQRRPGRQDLPYALNVRRIVPFWLLLSPDVPYVRIDVSHDGLQ